MNLTDEKRSIEDIDDLAEYGLRKKEWQLVESVLAYIIQNLTLLTESSDKKHHLTLNLNKLSQTKKKIFSKIIIDLYKEGIVTAPEQRSSYTSSSESIRSLEVGKNMIIPDISRVRAYYKNIKEISKFIETNQNEKFGEELGKKSKSNVRKVKISVIVEAKKGYLILAGEKIFIGAIESGKFNLVKKLCERGLNFGISEDAAFEAATSRKAAHTSEYMAGSQKMIVIRNQFKEIQRIIARYRRTIKDKKIKLALRLKLKCENNTIWVM